MADFTTTTGELSLKEMLADPIVQTIMAHDGVTIQDVEVLIETVRNERASRRMAEYRAGRRDCGPPLVKDDRVISGYRNRKSEASVGSTAFFAKRGSYLPDDALRPRRAHHERRSWPRTDPKQVRGCRCSRGPLGSPHEGQ